MRYGVVRRRRHSTSLLPLGISVCGLIIRKWKAMQRVLIHPDSDAVKLRQRLVEYGMSIDRYKSLLAQQSGVCAICQTAADAFVVDHDHDSGLVRGLLCHRCNTGLGNFRDSIDTLSRAVSYLKNPRPCDGDIVAARSTRRLLYRLTIHDIDGPGVEISSLPKRHTGRAVSQAVSFGWANLNGTRLRITSAGRKALELARHA